MIQKGYTVTTDVSLDGITMRAGDFATSQIASRVNIPRRNLALFRAWEAKAGGGQRQATIIFAADVQHIEDLVHTFRSNGIDARSVHGKTKRADRLATIEAFREGEFHVLINCGILTEGVDITRVDCIILGRPTKSGVLLQQMIGRGLRTHTDKEGRKKENCLVIDFADTSSDNNFGIHSTMPTLLGLRSDFTLPQDTDLGEVMERMQDRLSLYPDLANTACNLAELENMDDDDRECELSLSFEEFDIACLFSQDSIEAESQPLKVVSRLAWVRVGPTDCVLSLDTKTVLLIQRVKGGEYRATLREKMRTKESHWTREKTLLVHDSLTSAIRACDTWIEQKKPYLQRVISRSSPWRKKSASDAQIQFLQKKGLVLKGARPNSGMASDLITKFVYGAKGRATKEGVKQRKKQKLRAKRGASVLDVTI
ncbi:hypothetical protein BC830DRAFT_1165821 [Chytriomyces sp. MP71]|nr:hypothetical protein BC830DRAFT_1165821 [Chytriomyces sp. MP71]